MDEYQKNNRALRNSTDNNGQTGYLVIDNYTLHSISKKRADPIDHFWMNSI